MSWFEGTPLFHRDHLLARLFLTWLWRLAAYSDFLKTSPYEQLEYFGQVLKHVKTVGHVDRLRCPICYGFGVLCSAVPTDCHDVGTLLHPGGGSFGTAIRKQVHDVVRFQIHQDCPKALTTPEREVVNS